MSGIAALAALDLRSGARALTVATALMLVLCGVPSAMGIDGDVVAKVALVIAVVGGAATGLVVYGTESVCGWRAYAVSTGIPRRDFVVARLLSSAVLPTALMAVAGAVVGLLSGADGWTPVLAIGCAAVCLLGASGVLASQFTVDGGDTAVGFSFAFVPSACMIAVIVLFPDFDDGAAMLVPGIGMLVAICIAAAYAKYSVRSFDRIDL